MKFPHIPFSLSLNGKTYYTNNAYAQKLGRKLGKQVIRNLITVTYTNWDTRIDAYTGRKTIQYNTDNEPIKLSTRPIQVYGYCLAEKI